MTPLLLHLQTLKQDRRAVVSKLHLKLVGLCCLKLLSNQQAACEETRAPW